MQLDCGTEETQFSIFCDDLPKSMIEKGLRELNETDENRTKEIERLKKFLSKKQLKCPNEALLVSVLRKCKYNVKKSKDKLEKLLQTREMVARRLAHVPISLVKEVSDKLSFGILPYRDRYGRIIVFFRPFNQVKNYETDFLSAVFLCCVMFSLTLPASSILGTVCIGDAGGASIFLMYPYVKLYKTFVSYLFSVPLRIQKVDVVNDNFICRWLYSAIRIFIPGKVAQRLSFWGSGYEKLHETYHRNILPEDFGGSLDLFRDELYREQMINFIEELKSEFQCAKQ